MKILQVNCVYNKGSTGKIVHDIHVELQKQGIESVVCYGRGARVQEPNVYKTCGEVYAKANNLWSRVTGLMYGGCFFSTNRLLSIIRQEKPDIVHLHCINGYFVNIYHLITWLKKNQIKTVLTLHAEFMYTANCGYAMECEKWKTGCGSCPRLRRETKSWFFDGTARSWKKMKKAFDGFEKDCNIVSVSPWLMERAKQSPILREFRHDTVLNGIDTEQVFYPRCGRQIREALGLQNKKMVLHVTAAFSADPEHHKGGWYVIELAKRMPEAIFVVAGSGNVEIKLPDNVLYVGRVDNQQILAEYYSAADVTLLTSKKETFGMVAAESLCCGTPVVGFKAGATEMISLPEHSEFVEHGDLGGLEQAIRAMLEASVLVDRARAREKYAKQIMANGYFKLYDEQ